MTTTMQSAIGAFPADADVELEGDASAWAIFSTDRRYRYMLGRVWDDDGGQPLLVVGMCNPSKAGAFVTDPTVTRVVERGRRLGCRGVLVVNAGAWIATDPGELRAVADPVGPHNARAIAWAFRAPPLAIRVCAWGRMAQGTRRRLSESMSAMYQCGAVWCWGKTKQGEPRHPLMLSYATPLVHVIDGRPWPGSEQRDRLRSFAAECAAISTSVHMPEGK